MNRCPRAWWMGWLAGLLLLAGCATPPPPVERGDPRSWVAEELGFVRDGEATREEVLLRMGPPSANFEDGRILTYQVVPDAQGGWRLGNPVLHPVWPLRAWAEGACSLVLVFGPDGVLVRHNLVTAASAPE